MFKKPQLTDNTEILGEHADLLASHGGRDDVGGDDGDDGWGLSDEHAHRTRCDGRQQQPAEVDPFRGGDDLTQLPKAKPQIHHLGVPWRIQTRNATKQVLTDT